MGNDALNPTSVATQIRNPDSSAAIHSGKAISPVRTDGLAATQLHANFGKVPVEPSHVIDLMKDCYRLNGKPEISDALNSLIDSLAKKVEACGGQNADEIKAMVIEIIKKEVAAPVDKATSVVATQASSATSTTSAASTAKPAPEIPKATGFFGRLRNLLGHTSRESAVLNGLQEVAVREGIPDQLIQHKKELQAAKRNDTVKQKISETTEQIKQLADLNAFQKVLDSTESSVKLLAKTTSAEKKSLVDDLRATDLTNRKNDKSVTDQRIQESIVETLRSGNNALPEPNLPIDPVRSVVRKIKTNWSNRMADQRAKHDAAIPGYEKLQSKLAESLNNIVIPVLEPEVELNSAKLNALSQRVTELKNSESDRLPDLEATWNVAREAGNIEEANSLGDQIIACKQNIENSEKQKEKIVELQKLVSSAGLDLGAIRELNLQFAVTRNNANLLPFSLHMLGNGVQSPSVNEGFSLNQALRYGGSGRSNHAMSRSIALRTHLAEFGSDFNIYENSKNPTPETVRGDRRSFLSDLNGELRSIDGERADKVLDFLSTEKGRKYVHRLAASNVTAAGFNAKTLQLDAPSLAYKVENGFGWLNRMKIGRSGIYARDPGEYLGKRLSVLSRLSSTLQKELFREGKPINLDHAVMTPQHAVEASSLILAALPNDLLTVNHVEVTRFMKSLKEFEGEIQLAEHENRPVDQEKQISFKQVLNEFHRSAAVWVSKREAVGAEKSLSIARENSAEITVNGRKNIFRRASISLGHFINLAGGTAIREGWSSLQNYLSNINQKERLRQQFKRPENIALLAEPKRQLQALTQSENESDVSNARALLEYFNGRGLTVEMTGELSPQLKKTLLAAGNFLSEAWGPVSQGRPVPNVIGLSSVQTNSIPNYAATNLSKFAANKSFDEPLRSKAPTSRPTAATASAPTVERSPVVTGNQWISNLWGHVLAEGYDPAQQLAKLKTEYQKLFIFDFPEGSSAFSDQQLKSYFENLEAFNEIAVFAGRDVENIPASTLDKMKDLAPTLLRIRNGEALKSQLSPLDTRELQNVSGDNARCWLRSSWGAAVNALSKDEFTKRVGLVEQNDLTPGEIDQIYDQIKTDPSRGLQTSPLESKQRDLLISLMDHADGGWKKGGTLETLKKLKNGENPHVEGDFGLLFLNALGLPVIVHKGVNAIPEVSLPENFNAAQCGHPDTWPTLRYDGTRLSGHWQFYKKPAVA